MTTHYTRPRSIPARCVRRGDEMAFGPGIDGAPIPDADLAQGDLVVWEPVLHVQAGGVDLPVLFELDGFAQELDRDEPVVIREAAR